MPDGGLWFPSSVQYGDTFALVGGEASDQILVFDPDQESWITVDDTLSGAKYHAAAFLVDQDLFPDC